MLDCARILWHTNQTYLNIFLNTSAADIVIAKCICKRPVFGSFSGWLTRGKIKGKPRAWIHAFVDLYKISAVMLRCRQKKSCNFAENYQKYRNVLSSAD